MLGMEKIEEDKETKIKDEEDGEGRDFLIKKRKNIYWWGFQSNHIIIITLQDYSYNYKLKEKKKCNYNFIRSSYKIIYQITLDQKEAITLLIFFLYIFYIKILIY